MKLLIVTDHCFLRHSGKIYDNYCFDRSFFDDYRREFESVVVLCRVADVDRLPEGAARSDGEGVRFAAVPNLRRAAWLLLAGWVSSPLLKQAVEDADALVIRAPAQLGWYAARYARRLARPYVVEVIGDPRQAWSSSGQGAPYRLAGWLEARRQRWITSHAEAGSYVSRNGLSQLYPLAPGKTSDFISSIRLAESDLTRPRVTPPTGKALQIVQVGRLERRKRPGDLIRAGRLLLDHGRAVRLHFVGAGPERVALEALRDSLSMNAAVCLHGHIADRRALNRLLDQSDLFVLTSASEGLPRALLEAMARGLPALGTQIPGVDEILPAECRFPAGNIPALAALIERTYDTPGRLEAMSAMNVHTAAQYTQTHLSPKRWRLYRLLRERIQG